MAARPRLKKNRGLPEHLRYDSSKDVFRFTLINGKRKNLGSDRTIAIAIAREYNNLMRVTQKTTVSQLVKESGGEHGEFTPLSNHIDRLIERIINDESPAENTKADWLNDVVRIKEFFKNISGAEIELKHVNDYISRYHEDASNNVKNRKVSFLKKIFSYAVDESLMLSNPAELKKMRKVEGKSRKRLSLESYLLIKDNSEKILNGDKFLKIAMELSLQTTHARLEITRIKYNIKAPKEKTCGCVWFEQPKGEIFGVLYIHRQKTQENEAAHVAIPIGRELKRIIDSSRDNVLSPYIVHRLPLRNNKISKEVDHRTQIAPDYLSRAFSKVRDALGLYDHLEMDDRPTFHEIRALAAFLLKAQGYNPQMRLAHKDAKSTEIYTSGHIEWLEVPHVEISLKTGTNKN